MWPTWPTSALASAAPRVSEDPPCEPSLPVLRVPKAHGASWPFQGICDGDWYGLNCILQKDKFTS